MRTAIASGTLLSVKYRIETVSIPVHSGVATPGNSSDSFRELDGRRIIHVLNFNADKVPNLQETRVTVITEEAE